MHAHTNIHIHTIHTHAYLCTWIHMQTHTCVHAYAPVCKTCMHDIAMSLNHLVKLRTAATLIRTLGEEESDLLSIDRLGPACM